MTNTKFFEEPCEEKFSRTVLQESLGRRLPIRLHQRLARDVCKSNDLVAYENLQVRNLLSNHCLAKSISDAGWRLFRNWLDHFAAKFGKLAVAVEPFGFAVAYGGKPSCSAVSPHYTSQKCPDCHKIVKKSLSQRTHVCACGCVLQRDNASAIVILNRGKEHLQKIATEGHSEGKPKERKRKRKLSESKNAWVQLAKRKISQPCFGIFVGSYSGSDLTADLFFQALPRGRCYLYCGWRKLVTASGVGEPRIPAPLGRGVSKWERPELTLGWFSPPR